MVTRNMQFEDVNDDICLDEQRSVHFERVKTSNEDQLETKEVIRDKWPKKLDFILSAVGYAVGFGNVWRFPYLCYSNGGGAFLIPYFIMMTFAGLPLFYLELALGQYASLGPLAIWKVCPIFAGLGYAMIGLNLLISTYYNIILALSIFYFISSFTAKLPWSSCGNIWNRQCSPNIEQPFVAKVISRNITQYQDYYNSISFENTSTSMLDGFSTESEPFNIHSTDNTSCSTCPLESTATTIKLTSDANLSVSRSPAEEFWLYYVLGFGDDINIAHIGNLRWHLTLCNIAAWAIVFLCIIQGIKSSGKVVYFTATFPYVVLLSLFIRGVSLPGAFEGIKFYLVPDFSKMASVKVWNDAAIQILFSLGPGFGSLIMLGSYNKFHNRCDRDAILVTLVNCFTSVFAGFVIFSVLGFMSFKRGVAVEDVVDKGPGLAFIAYPEALSMMPGAPFWSICFFFMLFTLGLDSQFVGVESIVTGLVDEFPLVAKRKKTFTFILCFVLFLAGLPCITQGGMFVVELIDQFTTSFPLLVVVFFEAISIAWIYGIRQFSRDLQMMLGFKPNYYWKCCWMVLTPLIITFIFIFKCVEYKGLYYGQYRYPSWAEGIGWLIVSFLIGFIPFVAAWKFFKCINSFQNFWWVVTCAAPISIWKLYHLWTPDSEWGPSNINESNGTEDRSTNDCDSDLKSNKEKQMEEAELDRCRECRDAGRKRCICSEDIPDPLSSCFVVTY